MTFFQDRYEIEKIPGTSMLLSSLGNRGIEAANIPVKHPPVVRHVHRDQVRQGSKTIGLPCMPPEPPDNAPRAVELSGYPIMPCLQILGRHMLGLKNNAIENHNGSNPGQIFCPLV